MSIDEEKIDNSSADVEEDINLDDIDLEDDDEDDADDDRDWKAEALKNKAIAQRLANKIKKPVTPQAETPKPKVVETPSNSISGDDIDARVEAKLFKRDLDSLDVSEEVRNEIKKYAQANNLTVNQAANSKYINFVKTEDAEKKKIEEATISSKRKSQPKTDFAEAKPSDFDLSTPEGREGWTSYKNWLKNN
jgi:hypothetical protein